MRAVTTNESSSQSTLEIFKKLHSHELFINTAINNNYFTCDKENEPSDSENEVFTRIKAFSIDNDYFSNLNNNAESDIEPENTNNAESDSEPENTNITPSGSTSAITPDGDYNFLSDQSCMTKTKYCPTLDENYVTRKYEKKTEKEFCKVSKNDLKDTPPKMQFENQYVSIEKNSGNEPNPSAHVVNRVIKRKHHQINPTKKTGEKPDVYYNKNLIPGADARILSVEAAIIECGKLIFPETFCSSVHVVFDDTYKPTAISAKEIKNFKPMTEVPLTADKLNFNYLSHKDLAKTFKQIAHIENFSRSYKNDNKTPKSKCLFSDSDFTYTVRDHENYIYVKSLAQAVVASYFSFEEGDLHKENLGIAEGKFKRIDLDWALQELTIQLKNVKFIDKLRIHPEQFLKNEKVIASFPKLPHAGPRYHPVSNQTWSDFCYDSLRKNITHKDYNKNDHEMFSRLADHPVWIYHKYNSLLKSILSTKLLLPRASLHVSQNDYFPNVDTPKFKEYAKQPLAEVIANYMRDLTEQSKQVLVKMPEFKLFLDTVGKYALDDILTSYGEENKKTEEKINKLLNRLVSTFEQETNLLLNNPNLLLEDDEKAKQKNSHPVMGSILQQFKLNHIQQIQKIIAYQRTLINMDDIHQSYQTLLKDCELQVKHNEKEAPRRNRM